eukprot:gene7443-16117_t
MKQVDPSEETEEATDSEAQAPCLGITRTEARDIARRISKLPADDDGWMPLSAFLRERGPPYAARNANVWHKKLAGAWDVAMQGHVLRKRTRDGGMRASNTTGINLHGQHGNLRTGGPGTIDIHQERGLRRLRRDFSID